MISRQVVCTEDQTGASKNRSDIVVTVIRYNPSLSQGKSKHTDARSLSMAEPRMYYSSLNMGIMG